MKVFVVCLLAICLTFTCANTLFDEDDLPIDDGYMSADADGVNDVNKWQADTEDIEVSVPTDVIADGVSKLATDNDDREVSTDTDGIIAYDRQLQKIGLFCIRIWSRKVCVISRVVGNRINLAFTLNGKPFYSKSISSGQNYTFNLNTRLFGAFRLILKEFKIKVTAVDVSARKFCIAAEFKLQIGVWLKHYRYGPKCFIL